MAIMMLSGGSRGRVGAKKHEIYEAALAGHLYHPQMKLWKGNVFRPPGHSGQTPPWADTPWADTPLGRHPPGQTPLLGRLGRHPPYTGQMDTAADGTHPTGMHSCFYAFFTGPRGL